MALGVNSASNSNEYQEYFSVHRADTLTTFMYHISQYLGTPASSNPLGLNRPVQGLLYLYLYLYYVYMHTMLAI